MTEKRMFFTRTMARLHSDQGNPGKAAEIYRYLLQQEPHREDLAAELAAVEQKIGHETGDRLYGLFETWLDLAFTLNKVRKLRRIQQL